VRKLKRREKHLPVLLLEYKGSYELLNSLNCGFRLSIGLRVFCHGHEKLYSQDLMEGFQRCEVNLGSRSDIMLSGSPRYWKTYLRNNSAVSFSVTFVVVGIKCAIFVKRSTTINIISLPLFGIGID